MSTLPRITLRNFIEETLAKNGYVEIQDGVYLNTQESMIDEQSQWDAEDKRIDIDYTDYDFWITTDNGVEPEGFKTYDHALFEFFQYQK
jgi:hypothetical protein